MTSIFLIRHADYIEEPLEGTGPEVDQGLSATGRRQAAALADRLGTLKVPKTDLFIPSSERREQETAQLIEQALKVPIILDSNFSEWRADDGTLSEHDFNSQWQSLDEKARHFHRFSPGGETGQEFLLRVDAALQKITTEHAGKNMVIMTHGGVIQAAFKFIFSYGMAVFRRAYPAAQPTSITHWRYSAENERWVLEFSNSSRHLENTD